MSTSNLLFICTGNICRSPMAAVLALHRAQEMGVTIAVRSAGVMAVEGMTADRKALRAMKEWGHSLDAHRAQPLSAEHLAWADRVFVMQLAHVETIQAQFPDAPRAELLGPLCGTMEIDDPHGAWFMRPYRTTRQRIQVAVVNLIDTLSEPES